MKEKDYCFLCKEYGEVVYIVERDEYCCIICREELYTGYC